MVPAVVGVAFGMAGFVAIDGTVASHVATATQTFTSPRSQEPQHTGIRVRVIDGDTIENTATGERIRLLNIDTPETGDRAQCRAEREAGQATTRAARSIVSSGTVTVRRTGRTDRYGRTIGFVLVDGRDLARS